MTTPDIVRSKHMCLHTSFALMAAGTSCGRTDHTRSKRWWHHAALHTRHTPFSQLPEEQNTTQAPTHNKE